MENPQMQDLPSEGQNASGSPEYKGYETPGQDIIIESTSSAIQSPTTTSNERQQTPKPVIESIGQTPGDANPALAETTGFGQGTTSTADLLLARENAEEQLTKSSGNRQQYQEQENKVLAEETDDDTNLKRPNWPSDQQQAPVDLIGSPHAGETLLTGTPDVFGLDATGRQDAAIERDRTEGSKAEYGSGGLPSVGSDAEEDIYEKRDMHNQSEPSDLDRFPRMSNIPPKE